MQKIETTSPEAQSADIRAENIAQLKALFPELLTENANGTAINMDVLKALVGDATASDTEEKYGLNWHGKRRARQLTLTPSTGTLRPCPGESVDWDLCVPIETRAITTEHTESTEKNKNAGFDSVSSVSSVVKKEVHAIGGGVLLAYLSERIAVSEVEALAQGIVSWHKELAPAGDTTCVFRDSAFENDIAKSNLAAILKQYGIRNVRSL